MFTFLYFGVNSARYETVLQLALSKIDYLNLQRKENTGFIKVLLTSKIETYFTGPAFK